MPKERLVLTVDVAKVELAKVNQALGRPDLTPERQQRLLEMKRLLELKIKLMDNPRGHRIDRMREGERRRALRERQG